MFILGFAGCIGALRENTFLLKFVSPVLFFCLMASFSVRADRTRRRQRMALQATAMYELRVSGAVLTRALTERNVSPPSCPAFVVCTGEGRRK